MKRDRGRASWIAIALLAIATQANSGPVGTAGAWPSSTTTAPDVRWLVGSNRDDVEHGEFFRFFHFERSLQQPDPVHAGRMLQAYVTPGAFTGQVTAMLATDADTDVVEVAGLMVRREFIDTPRTTPFALDVVRSFVQHLSGTPGSDVSAFLEALGPECMAANAGAARCSGREAELFQVFAGVKEKARIAWPGGYLLLQNSTKIKGAPFLFVEMGRD